MFSSKVVLAIALGFFWWAGVGFFSARRALIQGQSHPLLRVLPKTRLNALLLLPLLLVLAGVCSHFVLTSSAAHATIAARLPAMLILALTGLISGCCVAVGGARR